MKIRTITTGVPHPFSHEMLKRAADFNHHCRIAFEAHGYEVQTTRLSSQAWGGIPDLDAALAIDAEACRLGIEFFSLGTIWPSHEQAARQLDLVPSVIANSQTLVASATLTTPGQEVAANIAEGTAKAMLQIAHTTPDGIGNMRFAALMNCPPNTPFFPAAYHQGDSLNFGLGWQAADLVHEACKAASTLTQASRALSTLLQREGEQVVRIAESLAQERRVHFVGLDVSPAPMGEESIARAIEALISDRFGSPGTLSAAAMITQTLQSLDLPLCGYCGLMLPILEDVALGERTREGSFCLDSLLLYSTVCGTGLDTIPIPGDTPPPRIQAMLTDVASLSIRLRKPLSARLFPVPGKQAGDMTTFASPYLTNTPVMRV